MLVDWIIFFRVYHGYKHHWLATPAESEGNMFCWKQTLLDPFSPSTILYLSQWSCQGAWEVPADKPNTIMLKNVYSQEITSFNDCLKMSACVRMHMEQLHLTVYFYNCFHQILYLCAIFI